jgi:hypothetical protein
MKPHTTTGEQAMGIKASTMLIIIGTLSLNAIAADLTISGETRKFIADTKTAPTDMSVDVNSPSLLERTRSPAGAALAYRVVKMAKDPAAMGSLSSKTNCAVVYDAARGRYIGYNHAVENTPLADTSSKNLEAVKTVAIGMLASLAGPGAGNFVYANAETDSGMTETAPSALLLSVSYRFTREINGRHIIDNTAFVRITFCGNNEVAGFEMADPVLRPVPLNRIVKESAADRLLGEYAAAKQVAIKNGAEYPVSAVNAEKGYFTYRAVSKGEELYLVPQVSFVAKNILKNGNSYYKWINFCLDASIVPNLDPGMVETYERK